MTSNSFMDNNQKKRKSNCLIKTVEDLSFVDPKEKVNSPRSLQALGELGIDAHKLYFVSFDDFMYMHPELKNISKDLQKKRYEHYEDKRKNKINEVKQRRKEIIEIEKNNINNSKHARSKSSVDYIKEQQSTVIKGEREKLRLLKNQQMGELKNIIEFEFKMEEIRKRNEEKMLIQQQKEEEIRLLKIQQQKEREYKQKLQEKKKEERLKVEMEEFERKAKEREEEDKRLYLEDCKRKEELEKDRQKRLIESKKRQELFRKKIEDILNAQQNELFEKQKEYLRKEEIRKKNLEDLKREIYLHSLEKSRKENEKIQKCLNRSDNVQSTKKSDYERKQKYAEDMRIKYAMEREEKKRNQEMLSKKKEKEIMEVLKRNDEIIQKRIDSYNKKQEEILERQRIRDKILRQEMKQKQIMLIEKEKRCVETRQKNEKIIEDNRAKILTKINSSDEKIQRQKEDNAKIYMKRYIDFTMRKDDIEDNIKQKEAALEFKRLKRLEEIEEKNKRMDAIKQQKMEIYQTRRKMQVDMQKEKERMLHRFDYIMKNSKNKSKDEIMKELFDENSHRYSMVKSKSTVNNLSRSQNTQNNDEGKKGSEFEFLTNPNPKVK